MGEQTGKIRLVDADKVMEQLREARFPVTELKQGAKGNGIQKTDDVVLYERAVEIIEQSVINDITMKGGDAYAQGKTYLRGQALARGCLKKRDGFPGDL